VEFETSEVAQQAIALSPLTWPVTGTYLTLKLKTKPNEEQNRLEKKLQRKEEKNEDEQKKEQNSNQPETSNNNSITPNVLLQIKGLPDSKASRFEVESFFSKFGKVKHVDAGHTNEEVVIVRFAEEEVAKEAFNNITKDNTQLGGHPVTATFIEGEEEQEYWKKNILKDPSKQSGRGRGRGGKGRGRGRGRGKRQKTD